MIFIDDVEARPDTRIEFSQMVIEEEKEAEEAEIFFIVEDMPDFQGGGQDAFRQVDCSKISAILKLLLKTVFREESSYNLW
jgi:hypothetical protein